MSHSEYCEWLIEVGCGWLGWEPHVVRYSHLRDIEIAYRGKVNMLKACYGSSDDSKNKNKKRVPTKKIGKSSNVEDFDKLFD